MRDELPPGGAVFSDDEIDARWAQAWRPEQVVERLSGVEAPWYVAAGWALDLFRGGQTRVHADLEIAVPAAGSSEVRACFPELVCDAVGTGRVWEEAGAEVLAATHQTWFRDPRSGRYQFDVFREPHERGMWVCRRDASVRLPYEVIVERTEAGIPYLVPELVLLFKAKAVRAKDQADFDGVLPLLGRAGREALRGWLELVHPGHPWLARLAG
ncbi:nucleotidyltransferase domain-containing protein [Streptomyces sp. NPDC087440]|uniref:nucleotidyltransferase domain-containing protein n=1 Tax=Streptomyces sp. NPDC087440 TaxID=3365790 RepID=UPI003825A4F8